MRILGAKKVLWLGYKDDYMSYDKEAREKPITWLALTKFSEELLPGTW